MGLGEKMNVLDIVKLAATYLQLNNLLASSTLGGTVSPTSDVTSEVNLLLTCVNLVNSIVASEYLKIKKTIVVATTDGVVSFNQFQGYKVNQILSIHDSFGNHVSYQLFDDHIKTRAGEVSITFGYLPNTVTLSGTITHYTTKMNERVFAYGVASEYSYLKAMYDDATMWDSRFKNSMQVLVGKKGEQKVKQRRWLWVCFTTKN